jgi:hypothetical protein
VVPVIQLLISEHFGWALLGLLAGRDVGRCRRLSCQALRLAEQLGGILDPLADKALLISCYLVLGAMGLIPLWLTLAVVLRDLIIVCGGVLYHYLVARGAGDADLPQQDQHRGADRAWSWRDRGRRAAAAAAALDRNPDLGLSGNDGAERGALRRALEFGPQQRTATQLDPRGTAGAIRLKQPIETVQRRHAIGLRHGRIVERGLGEILDACWPRRPAT